MALVIACMKTFFILVLVLLLAGCAGRLTLAELTSEAMASGDWSEVEKRERVIARSNALFGQRCPEGRLLLCEEDGGGRVCECVSRSAGAGKVRGP